MRRRNRADPVTLVRSPTFTNRESPVISTGSRPARQSVAFAAGGRRGGSPSTRSAMARMCSGVVPQHAPIRLTKPSRAKSPIVSAMDSGVSSYSPNAFGRPAFGCTLTKVGASPASSSTCGRSASGPRAQLSPATRGRAWATECQNAAQVCPDRVRPLASVMVADTMIGSSAPRASKTARMANRAALAFSVSKAVSIMRRSTPPSMSAPTASR